MGRSRGILIGRGHGRDLVGRGERSGGSAPQRRRRERAALVWELLRARTGVGPLEKAAFVAEL